MRRLALMIGQNMNKLVLLIIAISISASILMGCNSKDSTRIDIEIGTPRTEVIELYGEPQGTLSGFFGDIYKIDNSEVIVYYEVDKNNNPVVSNVKIIPIK